MTILAQSNFDSDAAGSLPPGWVNSAGNWVVGLLHPVSGTHSFGTSTAGDGDVALCTGYGTLANFGFGYSAIGAGSVSPAMGAVLRSDSANQNNYTVVFSNAVNSTVAVLLFKKTNGNYSLVTQVTAPLAYAVGDKLRFRHEFIGTTLNVYFAKDNLPSSPTVTFLNLSDYTSGYPGVYFGANQVDDFVLDDAVVVDTTAPTFVSAVIAAASPTLLQVTMSEALAASLPPNSAWVATASSSGARAPASSAINGSTVQLTFASAFTAGETISIAYTAPGANPRLQDSAATPNLVDSFGPSSVANNVGASVNNALTGATGNLKTSPANWDVQPSSIKTINAGAWFATMFGGSVCTLLFDLTNVGTPLPQISYQVDRHGPVYTQEIAASVTINVPTDTAIYANTSGHLLEVRVKSMTETLSRWAPQATAVVLTGIVLAIGKALSAPPALPQLMIFGDSITEGVRTVNMTAPNQTDANDSGQGWALEQGRLLGMDVGVVGFGGSGFTVTGSGGIPVLSSSYRQIYSGVARIFPAGLKGIVVMLGTNDGSDVTTAAIASLNGFIAATTCKIIVLRPFKDATHASQLQAAIAACNDPSRCAYVDTNGFFNAANSVDGLHPNGVENITHIAPMVANALRTILAGGPVTPSLMTRTVTMTLRGEGGALAANVTGIQVSVVDDPTRPAGAVIRHQSAAQSTNSAGVLSFTYQSTLTAGGTCGVDIVMPGDKRNMAVSVVVA